MIIIIVLFVSVHYSLISIYPDNWSAPLHLYTSPTSLLGQLIKGLG